MLARAQIDTFKENGYVNGGPLLGEDQVATLREELDRVLREKDREDVPQPVLLRNMKEDESTPVWQIVNIWEASEPFRDLHASEKILADMAQLTGAEELRIWHDQIQYKPVEIGGTTTWHQDAPLWPIIEPMTEVSAWVALDDVDEENGCMSMVPGSHLWGNQMAFLRGVEGVGGMPPAFKEHPVKVVRRPVRKGEVHYHHSLTWHASHNNTSSRPRRAIAIHYMTHETRYVSAGKHVMKAYVEVEEGEILRGAHFPTVWRKGA